MGRDIPSRYKILVADDERAIRRFLRSALSGGDFDVREAENGREALAAAASLRPDLIILDLGLPDMDGVEVIRGIREWSQTPIIVLSVREREDDKITALDAGADDYLTKPFGIGELLARMRAALRKSGRTSGDPIYRSQGLEVDLGARTVKSEEAEVQLTPTEYDLLKLFIANAGKVLTHRQVLNAIWGPGYLEQPHLLRVTVSNLRRKIEPDPNRPKHLVTEPGIGYRLRPPD